ncbi:MAG TPA: hypothetical protein VG712_05215 [Gemmatimonadales bacterium]|nr:hypothetical protein [Gemmatimonadales bacterium]
MFVGHTALALAAKRRSPELSLGWLFGAAVTLDLLWPLFLILGLEQVAIGSATGGFDNLTFLSYPWSHSLLTSIGWGAGMVALARWRGISPSSSLLLGLLVVSHWVLDWASHAPDMPLLPWGEAKVGLGLWASVPATYIVEGAMYVAGIWLYLGGTTAKDKVGSIGLWLWLLVMALMWGSGPFAPPPPSTAMVAWSTLIALPLLVVWAWWIDRHRTTTS